MIILIDFMFYVLLCSSYLLIILASALLVQGLVYNISKHKINLFKMFYNYISNLK